MPQAQGTAARLAYQIETTYGQVPASIDMKKLPFISGNPKQTRSLITSKVLSTDRNPRKPVRGNVEVSATIPTEFSPQMGTILKAAFGSSTPTGAGPYTHTIKIASSLPSMLIELGYTDLVKYLIYLGMKVNKLSLSVKPEGMQDLSIDLMGQCEAAALAFDAQTANFTLGATLTGGTSTHTALILGQADTGVAGKLVLYNHTGDFQDNEVITDNNGTPGSANADGTLGAQPLDASVTDPGHTPFDGFSIATVKEGGSIIALVSSIDSLTIENGLDGGNYVIGGGGRRRSLPEGSVRVSGTLNALFESMDLYNKAVRYQESSIELTYKLGTGSGTAGNEQMKITIPELLYTPNTPEVQGPQGIMVSLPFEAYYDNDAAASAMWIELKNAEPTI